MANLDNDIEQILVDARQLDEINKRLGEQITKDFADKNGFAMIFPMFPGGLMDKNDFNSYKDIMIAKVTAENTQESHRNGRQTL